MVFKNARPNEINFFLVFSLVGFRFFARWCIVVVGVCVGVGVGVVSAIVVGK